MLNHCGHGKTWVERCLHCEVISLRGTIESFEPMVIEAKEQLAEVEREIAAQATGKGAGMDMADQTDRTDHRV